MNKIKVLLQNKRVEWILIIIILLIAGLAHGYNMLHFPYYENDEGTYMSYAWSLLSQGKLSSYTYWYDHAPLGWILIAFWVKLTGGFFTFGTSVDSGRVLMLILHLSSTLFLFKIIKRLTKSNLPAIIACLFFSLSPLAIYFQRRVLLDNIMVFWVLLSFLILTQDRLKLRHIILSAIIFGVAVLSKETAIFFIPGFIALIAYKTSSVHKRFALSSWIVVSFSIISLYFLYALIKNEFFPSGTLLGGTTLHVSLIESFRYQLSRSGDNILDFSKSEFWHQMRTWFNEDRVLLISGIVSTVVILLLSVKKRVYLSLGLLSIGYWYFLIRGGVVIEFYIIPLIPVIAILNGIILYEVIKFVGSHFNKAYIYPVCTAIVISSLFGIYAKYGQMSKGSNIYTANQTKGQIEAIDWIRQTVDKSSIAVIDDYGYVDLHSNDNPSGKIYPNAEWYWKVDRDNAIKLGLLKNDPSNIDVIAMTPQMDADLTQGNLTLLSKAINKAEPIKNFWSDGWGVEIWLTKFPKQVLSRSWESYKKDFIMPDGRTIDPYNHEQTTSEAQSYTLLRAAWMDDHAQFDTTWLWTKKNMQMKNNLFSWYWGPKDDGSWGLKDQGTASDGDEDIALALLFAGKEWNNKSYINEAQKIISNIWSNEVKVINGKPYLLVGNWAKEKAISPINPSYLSPYSYRIFQQVDPINDWNSLVDASYEIVTDCSKSTLDQKSSANLLPDYCAVDNNGKIIESTEKGLNSTNYSYDAFRGTWRIALDYQWNKDSRAKLYLDGSSFLRKEWSNKGKIFAAYTHTGKPWEQYESVAAYGSDLGNFIVTDSKDTDYIYNSKVLSKFYDDTGRSYWDDPKNYYDQNWAWFGTALYSNNLPNLWLRL